MEKIVAIVILSLSVFFSCNTKSLDSEYESQLVIEGWIENGHSPVVFVSKSIPASSEPMSIDEIAESVLRYANVSIVHNGDSIPLTARLSDRYMLQNYFTSDRIKGETGEYYTLNVKWKEFSASATCMIPESCPIDTAFVKSTDIDTCFLVTSRFTNQKADMQKYQYFVRDDTSAFKAVKYAALDGNNLPEGPFNYDIGRQKEKDGYFHPGDIVTIKLATCEKAVYDFWSRFHEASAFSGNTLTPVYLNCKGNIDGALGYWAGYGISTYTLKIK